MKLKYIDALRGVAILAVIIVNTGSYGYNEFPAFFESLVGQGERGVQLFFVVSAFTLFLSFQYRLAQGGSVIQNFFIRRFFRIAPLYYLGIAYYLWQDGFGPRFWLGNEASVSLENILSNVFFVHGVRPTWISSIVPGGWSITAEMMFYLLIPLLIFRIKNLNQAIYFTLGTLVLAQLLKAIGYQYPPIEEIELWKAYLNLYLPSQLPVFGCGIIAYFLVIKQEYSVSKINLALLVSLLLGALIWPKAIPPNIAFGMAFLFLLFVLSKYEFKLIVNAPLQFLGTISFSAYLVHFAVLYWLGYWNVLDLIQPTNSIMAIINYVVRLGSVLLITVPVSYLSYRCIELPMQRLGKQIIALCALQVHNKAGVKH